MIGYQSDMGEKTAYNVAVGNAIKKARIAAGTSQSDLAVQLDSHKHTVYQYESGSRSVTPNTAYAIASALDTSVKDLFPDAAEIAAAQVNQIKKGQDGTRKEDSGK